jgi:hypothetical protein
VGPGRKEPDPLPQPEVGDQVVEAGQLGLALGAARPAHQQQGRGVGPLGQGGEGPHGDTGPLEGLDAAHEEQHRALAQAQEGPGLPLVAGGEEVVVDAGGHDLDALGDGAVQPFQLGRLVGRAGQDGVGAADDLGLGLGPLVVLLGRLLRFDPGQGVERRHQGQLEAVLDGVAHDAREPVVGVDHVGRAVDLDPIEHPVGELLDVKGQVLLGHRRLGPGGHVVDPEPRLHLLHQGQALAPRAGVDVAVDAGCGQGRRQLPDVDVHPPAVSGAGLGQGRRMEGDHGQAAHNGRNPTQSL